MTSTSQGIMILVEFPPTSREQAQRYAERAAALVHEEFGRRGHRVRFVPVKGKIDPSDKTSMVALERDAASKLGGGGYLPPLRNVDPFADVPTIAARPVVPAPKLLRGRRALTLGDDRLELTDREARVLIALRRESGRARRWVTAETLYQAVYADITGEGGNPNRRASVGGLVRRIRDLYPRLHLIEARSGRVGGYRWMADRFDLHESSERSNP